MYVVHCKRSAYDVYIGRPGVWGNPFVIGKDGDRATVVAKYREWLLRQPELVARARQELKGKILGCWCSPQACHGDVLAEIANKEVVMKPRFYAGIGSRETPREILDVMYCFGAELAENGFILRSGRAPGADRAFEHGCDSVRGDKRIYVPYKGAHQVYDESPPQLQILCTPEALKMAEQFHPNWAACSVYDKQYHGRNCHIILGKELNVPAEFVLCWTKDGLAQGGTGQGIRVARHYNIPVYDMGYDPEGVIAHAISLDTIEKKRKYIRYIIESCYELF